MAGILFQRMCHSDNGKAPLKRASNGEVPANSHRCEFDFQSRSVVLLHAICTIILNQRTGRAQSSVKRHVSRDEALI